MGLFRKKPVVIEARQYDGTIQSGKDIEGWSRENAAYFQMCGDDGKPNKFMIISTPEGAMTALPGDWIIKGVKGEFYPCKPDIFAMTYEACD